MTPGATESFHRPGQRGTRRCLGRSETVETQGGKSWWGTPTGSFPTELAWCPPSPRLLLSVKGASFPHQGHRQRPHTLEAPRPRSQTQAQLEPAGLPAGTLLQKVAGSEGCNLAGCGSNPGTCCPERTAPRPRACGGPPGSDHATNVYHHAFNSLLCSHKNRKTCSPETKNLEFSNQEKGS